MTRIISSLILILSSSMAFAGAPKVKPTEKPSSLRTDFTFTASDVGGKYQTPGEAISTVENEKALMDLIEPRQEFKDRLRKSVTQR